MLDAKAFEVLRKNGANPVMAVGVLPTGTWQTVTDVALKAFLSDPAARAAVVRALAECLDKFVSEQGEQINMSKATEHKQQMPQTPPLTI